jgi:hypothetical protein
MDEPREAAVTVDVIVPLPNFTTLVETEVPKFKPLKVIASPTLPEYKGNDVVEFITMEILGA